MKDYQSWLALFMNKLTFPENAKAVFFDAFERILKNEQTEKEFSALLAQYEEDEFCPYGEMINATVSLGDGLGIHEYTAGMLLFLCLAKTLLKRYQARDIDEQIFWDSMMDLRYKLEECRLVKGKVGSFVCTWFPGFFKMTRFALGRLQFDLTALKAPVTVNGITLPEGTSALGVHIPRSETPLDHSEVKKSYAKAAKFFAKEFEGKPIVFFCSSWLLDPWILTVLSPNSNITAFYKDFTIVNSGTYEGYSELWRLFDCEVTNNPTSLPRNSSLRRAYAERIEHGKPIGWGQGIFVY